MKTYVKLSKSDCAPCKMVAQFLESTEINKDRVIDVTEGSVANAVIAGKAEEGKLYNVLVDDFPEVAGHFEISSVPVIIELKEGKETYRISGFVPPYLEEVANNLK